MRALATPIHITVGAPSDAAIVGDVCLCASVAGWGNLSAASACAPRNAKSFLHCATRQQYERASGTRLPVRRVVCLQIRAVGGCARPNYPIRHTLPRVRGARAVEDCAGLRHVARLARARHHLLRVSQPEHVLEARLAAWQVRCGARRARWGRGCLAQERAWEAVEVEPAGHNSGRARGRRRHGTGRNRSGRAQQLPRERPLRQARRAGCHHDGAVPPARKRRNREHRFGRAWQRAPLTQ